MIQYLYYTLASHHPSSLLEMPHSHTKTTHLPLLSIPPNTSLTLPTTLLALSLASLSPSSSPLPIPPSLITLLHPSSTLLKTLLPSSLHMSIHASLAPSHLFCNLLIAYTAPTAAIQPASYTDVVLMETYRSAEREEVRKVVERA